MVQQLDWTGVLGEVKHERLKDRDYSGFDPETLLWYPIKPHPKIEDNKTP
jgi:hypothetical protein